MDWLGTVMTWLKDNLAVLSGLLIPVLVALIGPLTSREAGSRLYRRVRRHAQLRAVLKDGTSAADRMDELLEHDVRALAQRHTRAIDKRNLGTIIGVSIVGGLGSFFLASWALSAGDGWAVLAWVLFYVWTGSIVLLVLVGGLPNFYEKTDQS